MADDNPQDQRAPKERNIISHLPFFIKIVEVVLAVFAIGLVVDPLNSFQRILTRTRFKLDDAAIIYVTIAGYIIINTLFIICHFLGDNIPKRTLVVLLIFVLVIYTIAAGDTNVSSVTCILLIVLSGIYVFILAIDLISQFSGGELHSFPMFLFSLLGVIFFGVAGILLISVYNATTLWYILTTLCLCLLMSAILLIEVAMILAFWKRNCNLCKQCCYTNQAEILFQKNICHPLCTTVKYDLTTSVSSLRIPSGDEKGIPDHAYRKVGYGRRRQYVDCPTSAKSVSKLDSAECQTDRRATFHTESQTQRSMKEMPVQTVSKCDLCNRQLQIFSTTADMQAITQSAPCTPCPALVQLIRGVPCCPGCVAGIVQVPQQSEQQQTQRQDQEKKPTKDQMQWVQPDQKSYGMLTSEKAPVDQVASGQHEDPKITGMAGTITKLTLASYSVAPSKKTNTSSQTATDEVNTTTPDSTGGKKVRLSTLQKEKPRGKRPAKNPNEMLIPEKEKAETTNDVEKGSTKLPSKKPTSPSAQKSANPSTKKVADSQNIVESTVTDSASVHENPEIPSPIQQMAQVINRLEAIENSKTYNKLQETSDISTPTVDGSVEKTVNGARKTDKNGVDESSEALPKINAKNVRMESDVDDATVSEITFESIKSDKDDESIRKQDDSTRVERGTLPVAKPDTRTQTTDIDVSLIKPKRTRLLRKKNKVEPAELTHAEMDIQTSYSDDLDVLSIGKQESERLFVGEKQALGIEKDTNICRACRRLQTYPTSNSFRYYSVYRDKRGSVYCELCATANTIKVLYKDDGSELKRLRCVVCKNVVRAKSSQEETTGFRSKSDNCPKCGQVQTRAHSTLVNPSKV